MSNIQSVFKLLCFTVNDFNLNKLRLREFTYLLADYLQILILTLSRSIILLNELVRHFDRFH